MRVIPDRDRFPLRELRLRRGMTQAEVAAYSRLSRRYYVEIEHGRQEPGVVAAILLADALGATVEEAFGHLVKGAAPAGKP
jgi:transcriptional regulator with XRE-family HTH domain